MGPKEHWERIYRNTPPPQLGWHRPHLELSRKWIQDLGLSKEAEIIDAGGGVSTLVDDLLREGYRCLTVVDLSAKALALARERLGKSAGMVTWLEGDITSLPLPAHRYEVWHDRAVFHFLTSSEQRQQYQSNLLKALKPGAHVIMATFAIEAPSRCSGLHVERYSASKLADVLGPDFDLQRSARELHLTPGGVEQPYLYCLFRKTIG